MCDQAHGPPAGTRREGTGAHDPPVETCRDGTGADRDDPGRRADEPTTRADGSRTRAGGPAVRGDGSGGAPGKSTRFLLAAGGTETAAIEGISAAGAGPDLLAHTPSADAEILTYGRPVRAPVVPVSPTGCPTPAVVSRAVRELLGVETAVVDAGLAAPTAAPTVDLGASPGGDVRESDPVPHAGDVFERAREFGRSLPDERLVVAETVPGGTTTALGTLAALGERETVSSSLRSNPLALKREVVAEGLAASGLARGGAAGEPTLAVREMGDPVLAAIAGVVVGAVESDRAVELAGGTQLLAAAALVRHAGVDDPLALATTSYVAADPTADLRGAAADLDVTLTVTDPGFAASDHPSMAPYADGEAKEGVGMGGTLALADRADVGMDAVRGRVRTVYDRLFDGPKGERPPVEDEHP